MAREDSTGMEGPDKELPGTGPASLTTRFPEFELLLTTLFCLFCKSRSTLACFTIVTSQRTTC